jgi:hypothetical protein
MKKVCWALAYRGTFVTERRDFSQPVPTALFRTRKHALVWLEENPYWSRLKAQPVRVKVTIAEV